MLTESTEREGFEIVAPKMCISPHDIAAAINQQKNKEKFERLQK